jgi:uncharacterized protein (TIGR02217 family)
MAFHDTAFLPVEYSYGSAGGPSHETVIQQSPNGRSLRIARLDEPIMRYEIDLRILDENHVRIGPLINFVRARKGSLHGFRLMDFADYSTNATHIGQIDVSDLDARHELGIGDNNQTVFSLVKTYTDSGESVTRRIEKPMRVAEANQISKILWLKTATRTIWVWVDGTLKSEGSDYTVDYALGKITFASAPNVGEVVTWAGYFAVPVFFGPEADRFLRISASSYAERQTDTITMIETKQDTAVLAMERDPRGAKRWALSAAVHQLDFYYGQTQLFDVDAAGASMDLHLPEPADWMLGGPLFFIGNISSTANLVVKTYGGAATVLTLAPDASVSLFLVPDGSGGYDWVVV